jgi:hypothetical protein
VKSIIFVFTLIVCTLITCTLGRWAASNRTFASMSTAASDSVARDAPDTEEWQFAVSGDSRNCGDLVMPAIAEGAQRDRAAFYWHLGDFRAIYKYDEDLQSRKPLTIIEYQQTAWNDFIQMQVRPFEVAHIPVYLGIGNHETIPPKTREQYLGQFADWLGAPFLRDQRLADDENAHQLQTYYHWTQGGVDFINLDNASDDQFDKNQMNWFNRVVKKDRSDPSVHTIVVGMHKALPDSLGNWHSMSESAQGIFSGRCVYKTLAKAQMESRKHVYILASHSHFYMEDIFNTDFWHQHGQAILPGWIVGTAGAVRYRLPAKPPARAKTDVYGYLLATVNAGGQPGVIQFAFKEIAGTDGIPADVRNRFSPDLVNFCFDQNKDARPAGTLPEPPDGTCPE